MKFIVVAALCTLGLSSAWAQIIDTTPVIEASGLGFTKGEFESLVKGDSRYVGVVATPAGKRALADDFGKAFALEAEARRWGIDRLPSVQLKIRHATQQLLADELITRIRAEYLKDEAALSAQYEKSKLLYEQPRVRQILVRFKGSEVAARPGVKESTVEEARAKAVALRDKLLAGADMGTLARDASDDPGARASGGDLGYVRRGALSAPVETAAFSQAVGSIGEVIRSEYGFHILRVEERKPQPLEAVRAVIANDLAHRDIEALVLRGYKLNDAYFAQ